MWVPMTLQGDESEHEFLGGLTTIFDLEFTAWEGSAARGWSGPDEYREIVQIGAVRVDGGNAFAEVDRFTAYVRPVKNPVLSDYFVSLTGITQADVDRHGVSFPEALAAFSEFVGDDGAAVVSNDALPITAPLTRTAPSTASPAPSTPTDSSTSGPASPASSGSPRPR